MNNRIRIARGTSDKRKISDLEIVPGQLFLETDSNSLYTATDNSQTKLKDATPISSKAFIVSQDQPKGQDNFNVWSHYNVISDSFIGNWYGESNPSGIEGRLWQCGFKYTSDGQIYLKFKFYSAQYSFITEVSAEQQARDFSSYSNLLTMKSRITNQRTAAFITTYYDLSIQKIEDTLKVNFKLNSSNSYEIILNKTTNESEWNINFNEVDLYTPEYNTCNLLYKKDDSYVDFQVKEALNSVNASKAVVDLKDNVNKSLTLKYGYASSSSGSDIYDSLGDLLLESSPLTSYGGDECKVLYSFPIYLSTSSDASPSTSSPDFSTEYYLNSYYNNVSWIEVDLTYSYPSSSSTISVTQTLKCKLQDNAGSSAIFHGYNEGNLLKLITVSISLTGNYGNPNSPRRIRIHRTLDNLKISDNANVTENGTWRISGLRGIK